MNRLIALMLSLVLLPFTAFILFLSLLFQGRPLFFIQERVGRNREPFMLYKIRTMEAGKVTSFGGLLRKTGLDEFPQLINVIRGEMAFIGPRPLTSKDIIRLGWDGVDFDIRWSVLPGMTGPAQISPVCSKENSWRLDEQYCSCPGIGADMRIFAITVLRLVSGRSEVR